MRRYRAAFVQLAAPLCAVLLTLASGCNRGSLDLASCLSGHGDTGDSAAEGLSDAGPSTDTGDAPPDDPFPNDDPPAPLDASCEDEAVDPGELCFVLDTKSAGIDPCDIAGADFNLDGEPDLAVPNSDPSIIDGRYVANLLFGNGVQTGGPLPIEVGGPLPVRIAASDFSGDGNPDFVIATASTLSVTFMNGYGDGDFAPPMAIGIGRPAGSLAAGDFDGDGRSDLAVGTDGDFAEVIFTRPGGPGQVQVSGSGTVGDVAAIDLDGDGRDELAISTSASTVELHRFADGGFEPIASLAGASLLDAMLAGDMDGDGDQDLFALGSTPRQLHIYRNAGGTLVSQGVLDLTFSPRDLALDDFNSDGRLDIAITDTTHDQIVIFTQDPGGASWSRRYSYPTGRLPVAVVSADFNHDGVPDLATADQLSNRVSVYLSTP